MYGADVCFRELGDVLTDGAGAFVRDVAGDEGYRGDLAFLEEPNDRVGQGVSVHRR